MLKYLRHPATIISALALFVALGGGAAAYASGLIPGSRIKNHSIATKKLTQKAISSLRGKRGPAGAAGPTGPAGAPGPQGPGGTIVRYDATAKSSPTTTTLGTFLGVTIGASCSTSSGNASLTVYIKTTDGSWNADYSFVKNSNGTVSSDTTRLSFPAGTFNAFAAIDARTANAGGHESDGQLEFVQLGPSAGSMIWHETAVTTASAQTCHLSVQSFPETISSVAGAAPAAAGASSKLPLQLTAP